VSINNKETYGGHPSPPCGEGLGLRESMAGVEVTFSISPGTIAGLPSFYHPVCN
jgi:hypothetical protein